MRREIKCPHCSGTGIVLEESSTTVTLRSRIQNLLERTPGFNHTLGSIAACLEAREPTIRGTLQLMTLCREICSAKYGSAIVYEAEEDGGQMLMRLDLQEEAIPSFDLLRTMTGPKTTVQHRAHLARLVLQGKVELLESGERVYRWRSGPGGPLQVPEVDQGRYRSVSVTLLE